MTPHSPTLCLVSWEVCYHDRNPCYGANTYWRPRPCPQTFQYRDVCRGRIRALMDIPIPISPRPTGHSSTDHKYGITTPGLGLGKLDMWSDENPEEMFQIQSVFENSQESWLKTLFQCFTTQIRVSETSWCNNIPTAPFVYIQQINVIFQFPIQ